MTWFPYVALGVVAVVAALNKWLDHRMRERHDEYRAQLDEFMLTVEIREAREREKSE